MLKFDVNNGRTITLIQSTPDSDVQISTTDSAHDMDTIYYISPGDFVTMLNWYKWQKSTGNDSLTF